MSNTYCNCVCVALGIQHAVRMLHTDMCPARLYDIFPHYLKNSTILRKTLWRIKSVF